MTRTQSALASAIVIIIIILGAIVYFVSSDNFNPYVSRKLSTTLGREVSVTEKIDIDWGWPITRIHAQNISLANFKQGTKPEMVTIGDAKIAISLLSILKGNLYLPEVTLQKPELLLEKDKDGNANWKFLDHPGANLALDTVTPDDRSDVPAIGRLVIKEGKLTYIDPATKTNIDLAMETITGSGTKRENLHLHGEGIFQTHDFSITIDGGNIFQLKDGSDPYPIRIDTAIGATKITLAGTMLDPLQFKGMDTTMALKGKDAAELFDIFGIALPPTPPYDIEGKLSYKDDIWHFDDFSGTMGKSDLRGSVTWDTTHKRPLLSGEFKSKKLNFADLGGLIGAGPGASTKTKIDPYVIPDTPLDISRLKAMDAKVTFTGDQLVSNNLPLDDFFMDVDLEDSLLKLQPVRFGTAKGDISAYLTVNARQEPVLIDGDFRFHRLDLKPMFEKLSASFGIPNYAKGYVGGTAKLQGTGKSLRQMLASSTGTIGLGMEGGQFSNLVIELLGLDVAQGLGLFLEKDKPVNIRCMIGDFKVSKGLMQVQHFVLDTTDSNILGKGTINLKNEALNLTLYTNPKDSSPLTLNSPIGLRGTLKDPDLQVHLGNVAGRSAIAVALASLIFPVAAIAAFVEPALGKDSPCAALIREMAVHNGNTASQSLIPHNKTEPLKQ